VKAYSNPEPVPKIHPLMMGEISNYFDRGIEQMGIQFFRELNIPSNPPIYPNLGDSTSYSTF